MSGFPRHTRRSFLGTAVLGGVGAALGGRAGLAAGTPRPPLQPAAPVELEELTLEALQGHLSTGGLTARALVERYTARIEALDWSGPALRSVIELNPDAVEIAERLDAERAAGRVRGPLHGVPVLLKDNIATADRTSSAAGSLALDGFPAPRDSFVARRLREAGAVLLGKANLSEWANIRSRHSTSGWSARGGLCRNPYALDRNCSGSSSGSAAAVSANLVPVAVGTETDGSVVSPATYCGIVGLKPTVGLVSRTGIIPISATQDTAGPMTRSVADTAILLGALAGPDPADPATREAGSRGRTDYHRFLDRDGLRGARIGVPRKRLFGYSPHADRVAEEALDAMRRMGAEIVDPADIPTLGEFDDAEWQVLLYEFKHGLNAYLADLGPDAPVKSLAEVIAFNERHRDRELRYFGQDIFIEAQEKGGLDAPEYREALEKGRRLAGPEGIDRVMDANRLDALVCPTGAPASLTDLVNGDAWLGGGSGPAAVSGYPHVTVPAGEAWGLPVGISFFGRAWSEPVLLRLAYAFEQETRARRTPRFLETLELS